MVSDQSQFEIVVIGGGVAGASLATVLARTGRRVAVIEREPVFRDRVRGEGLHPWGYREAVAIRLDPVIRAVGANPLPVWQGYTDRIPDEPSRWDDDPENEYPEFGVSHPALQEATLAAAARAGARIYRPMSARRIEPLGTGWDITLEGPEGVRQRVGADLLIGADGRDSAVRRWLEIPVQTDPVHHRFGGMLIEGFGLDTGAIHSIGLEGGTAYVMPQCQGHARIYAGGQPALLAPIVKDRSGASLIELLAANLPDGAMSQARPAGPMAFFPNSDMVPARIAGDSWALGGDAAGSNDPSVGQGLSLTYRDVRRLSELLTGPDSIDSALATYAAERSAYHATAREHARWIASFTMETGDAAEARREGYRRSGSIDPTRGGFTFMYTRGPMGLVADEAARRRFFDEP